MHLKTYLTESLKNGYLMRWTFMPLNVYIAPMKFYSKQGENYRYQQMVINACEAWERASKGKVSFRLVENLLSSNINIEWRRIDRKALGHCTFNYDNNNRLYGAEVSIGISDGAICQQYMDEGEVYHTILHEIGHALGLGHSKNQSDIMYTPHRYGVLNLSERDVTSIQWLYTLHQGASVQDLIVKYGVQSNNIDEIITKVITKDTSSTNGQMVAGYSQKKDLLDEQTNIAALKKYHLALQNISLSPDLKKMFNKPKSK